MLNNAGPFLDGRQGPNAADGPTMKRNEHEQKMKKFVARFWPF